MDLVLVFFAGFVSAGIDGSLGMGFGPTSATLLLASGMSPAAAATTVNIAKTGAGIAGAMAHLRAGNVDRRIFVHLAIPGAIGAAAGAVLLVHIDAAVVRPVVAALLAAVGLRVLWQFSRPASLADAVALPRNGVDHPLALAGLTGGCTNGAIGAWGPVVTPFLLHRRVPPRLAVGSANAAEVAVAVIAAATLLRGGTDGLALRTTAAMLAGGILAAPIAAWLVRRIPTQIAGLALAGLLLGTQARELATSAGLGWTRWVAYGVIVVAVLGAPRIGAVLERRRRPASPASLR